MKLILYFILLPSIALSCKQWSEKDTEKYMEDCKKSKFEKAECDCHIEKIKSEFNSFEELSENEELIPELIIECSKKIKMGNQ